VSGPGPTPAEGFLQALGAAYLSRRIYARGHPRLETASEHLLAAVRAVASGRGPLRLALVGCTLECDGRPAPGTDVTRRLASCLEAVQCAGIQFAVRATRESLERLLEILAEEKPIPAEGVRLEGIDLFAAAPEAEPDRVDEGIAFALDEFEIPMRVYRGARAVFSGPWSRRRRGRPSPSARSTSSPGGRRRRCSPTAPPCWPPSP
jgi:hypothetical protein